MSRPRLTADGQVVMTEAQVQWYRGLRARRDAKCARFVGSSAPRDPCAGYVRRRYRAAPVCRHCSGAALRADPRPPPRAPVADSLPWPPLDITEYWRPVDVSASGLLPPTGALRTTPARALPPASPPAAAPAAPAAVMRPPSPLSSSTPDTPPTAESPPTTATTTTTATTSTTATTATPTAVMAAEDVAATSTAAALCAVLLQRSAAEALCGAYSAAVSAARRIPTEALAATWLHPAVGSTVGVGRWGAGQVAVRDENGATTLCSACDVDILGDPPVVVRAKGVGGVTVVSLPRRPLLRERAVGQIRTALAQQAAAPAEEEEVTSAEQRTAPQQSINPEPEPEPDGASSRAPSLDKPTPLSAADPHTASEGQLSPVGIDAAALPPCPPSAQVSPRKHIVTPQKGGGLRSVTCLNATHVSATSNVSAAPSNITAHGSILSSLLEGKGPGGDAAASPVSVASTFGRAVLPASPNSGGRSRTPASQNSRPSPIDLGRMVYPPSEPDDGSGVPSSTLTLESSSG